MNLNYHIYYGNKKVFFSIPRGILHAASYIIDRLCCSHKNHITNYKIFTCSFLNLGFRSSITYLTSPTASIVIIMPPNCLLPIHCVNSFVLFQRVNINSFHVTPLNIAIKFSSKHSDFAIFTIIAFYHHNKRCVFLATFPDIY